MSERPTKGSSVGGSGAVSLEAERDVREAYKRLITRGGGSVSLEAERDVGEAYKRLITRGGGSVSLEAEWDVGEAYKRLITRGGGAVSLEAELDVGEAYKRFITRGGGAVSLEAEWDVGEAYKRLITRGGGALLTLLADDGSLVLETECVNNRAREYYGALFSPEPSSEEAQSHSLLYYYTLNHGSADLPEYIFMELLDGCETTYYDKNMKTTVPRQRWMAEAFDKSYWDKYTITQAGFHGLIKGQVDGWLRQNNQTSSTHYIQGLFGCELNDANPSGGVLKLAYDGRFAFSFDKDTLVWTVHDSVAQTFKAKWDKETKMNRYFKSLIEKDCVDLWRTYYSIGNVSLTRKVSPEVSVIARAGDRWFLHCIVIGFYPQSINVTWLKNGEHAPETKSTGVLPNEDGTYQLTTSLEFDPYDGKQYSCHIEHSSLPGGKTVSWEGKDKHVGLIVMCGLVSLAFVIVLICMWRRKRRAFQIYSQNESHEKPEM
uniref:class I histocompatibility antigen, F10 alpha chain-like n=1 Tax=Pristiophorus japonicus TaxID=55135 RepID=UPI00398E58DE